MFASTGARQITPIIAIAREPIAMKPSSNFSPSPNLFPKHLSIAPRAINTTMIYTIISLIPIVSSPY